MIRTLLLLMLFGLAACSMNTKELANSASEQGAENGLKKTYYNTSKFKVFTLSKITDKNLPIHVYLEGDGRAFIEKNIPSTNPTPHNFLMLNLASQDKYPNILYIARPCQFVEDDKSCTEKYWTYERFSNDIIFSINDVLDNFPNQKLELIGYSGGGGIAIYLTTIRNNIDSIRTIAGNIHHQAFNNYHKVPQFINSPNLKTAIFSAQNIPQIHFIGSDDEIVPKTIAQEYQKNQQNTACTKLMVVPNATHTDGWEESWLNLLSIKPACSK